MTVYGPARTDEIAVAAKAADSLAIAHRAVEAWSGISPTTPAKTATIATQHDRPALFGSVHPDYAKTFDPTHP